MADLYRPSNGTEGESFIENWCERCKRDRAYQESNGNAPGCEIVARSFAFEIDHPKYPREWTFRDDGQPVCTAFEDLNAPEPPDPNQLALEL